MSIHEHRRYAQMYSSAPQRHSARSGRSDALEAMGRPEFAGAGQMYSGLNAVPPQLRLFILAALVLFSAGACAGITLTTPSYPPSPNVERHSSFDPTAPASFDAPVPAPAVQR